jgi:hypothetical protein
VTHGDRSKPTRAEAWLEARTRGYEYGYVLLLLGMTFIVMASGPPSGYTRVLTVVLQGLTLMAALLASRAKRHYFRFAAIVTAVSILAAVGSVFFSQDHDPTSGFFLLNILLVATVPWVIARALWTRKVVDVRTVLGAVCIYVLLGMMFAFLYAAIDGLSSEPFFAQITHASVPDFLYFSFITQTTVGYGDLTARADLGRALSVVEALAGQLYLVTVIAVLVSRLSTVIVRPGVTVAPPTAPEPAAAAGPPTTAEPD